MTLRGEFRQCLRIDLRHSFIRVIRVERCLILQSFTGWLLDEAIRHQ